MNKRYNYIYVLKHFAYDLCHMIRYKKLSFPVSSFNVNNVFDLMYLDIWDDFSATSAHGFKYFLVVLYYHSRHFWLEKIKFKQKVSNYVRSFVSMVKTQFVKKIYVIRSDNGSFILNSMYMNSYCIKKVVVPLHNKMVYREKAPTMSIISKALMFKYDLHEVN